MGSGQSTVDNSNNDNDSNNNNNNDQCNHGWNGTGYDYKDNDSVSCREAKSICNNALDRMTGEADDTFQCNVIGPMVDTCMLNEGNNMVADRCCGESSKK